MANEKRLIDANALIDDWNKAIKRMVRDSDGKAPVDFGLVICEISKAPTVEAVEVVHGHNVYDHDSAFECSVCGWSDWDTLTGDGKYNYCPNCGADMRDGDGNA